MKNVLIFPILAVSLMVTDFALAGTMGPDITSKNWTGFYAGANGGAGLATAASSINTGLLSPTSGTGSFSVASHELNGFLAGGQAGYPLHITG